MSRVDAVVDDRLGALGVLRMPARGGRQVGHQFRAPRTPAARLGRRRHEVDQTSLLVERVVVPDAAHRGAPQVGRRGGRLLALQHRVGDVDGDEVGEAGYRDLRQFVRGAHHVEGGADAQSRVVQQLEPLTCDLRPAGHRLELGGVAQCHHDSLGASVTVRGPLVDREQTLAGEVHLVGGLPAGDEQRDDLGVEVGQLRHVVSLGVRGQLQQPPGLVVREQQPAAFTDDEHPFAYGVQHGVVVVVHAGHLGRRQAVGLTAQPPAHQGRHSGGHDERGGTGAQDDRQLPVHLAGHVLDLQPGRDEGHHLAGGVLDGNGGLHFVTEGTVHALGVDLPGQGGADVAHEPLSDPARHGMGVPDALGVHHDDEVDTRRLASRLGERLEHRRRIGRPQCRKDARGMGEGLGDGDRAALGLGAGVPLGLQDEREDGAEDEEYHQRHLHYEHLPGDTSRALAGQRTQEYTSKPGETVRHGTFLAPTFHGGHGLRTRVRHHAPLPAS